MAQEIEIEYKALLTEAQFEALNHALPFPTEPVTQVNHYFETEDFKLKEKGAALRIRMKNNTYILTLKEPYEDAILETHDTLTAEEFKQWTTGSPVSKKHTTKQLQQLGIPIEELKYYGALTTERKSYIADDIIYVLDKSFYNNQVDYELEIEAPSHEKGKKVISELIDTHNIDAISTTTKIERFFTTLAP